MKNSYSVAALTPIGRLFCSYVAGANAPPISSTQQAAYDADMQVRLDRATFEKRMVPRACNNLMSVLTC